MPISSIDLLNLAQRLMAENPSSECLLRASIGRAYYAVYHEAQSTADVLGLSHQKTSSGVHEQLISRYEASGKRLKVIANRLATAKMYRVEADYKINHMVSVADARKHLASCQSIVGELTKLQASCTGT
ncbi:HEPN domain-containing protein [Pseudomonas phage PG1]|nr:HEPN domain-containing protein [Pseudomonas phage PG1]